MLIRMTRTNRGFTVIEIVVVLILISIIATAVFSRSITTDQMNFLSQYDKIQNQFRYPQSIAMKRSEWWGISCDTNDYWMFTGTNQTVPANRRRLPGQEQSLITLSDLGINMVGFTLIFDKYGRPYSPDWTTPLNANLVVNMDDGGSESKTVTIIPETGLIK